MNSGGEPNTSVVLLTIREGEGKDWFNNNQNLVSVVLMVAINPNCNKMSWQFLLHV